MAVVDENGTVTAIGSGNAVITVATVDGGFAATCAVTVTVKVTSVTVSPTSLSLTSGEQSRLTATVSPANATDKTFTWSSSVPDVATVDSAGNVTAQSVGSAIIRVTTSDGNKQAQCEVIVGAVAVTGITITPPSITLLKGQQLLLDVVVEPEEATDKRVTWNSSNSDIVSVSSQGVISTLAGGQAVITATTVSGNFAATCQVTVRVPVTSVAIEPASLVIPPGGTGQLTAVIAPDDATSKSVTWSSSNTAIATVSAEGLVNGLQASNATITVSTNDGHRTATASVRVGIPVTGITISPGSIDLMSGGSTTLTATILPANATDKTVTWTSSAPAVATVNVAGLLTAANAGTATITATTADGGYTATASVRVGIPVSGVSINPTSMTIEQLGGTGQLNAVIAPANATNKAVTWTSSNSAVATVSTSGLVTGVSMGTTTITATTSDGGYAAPATVQVGISVTGVTVAPTSLSILPSGTGQLTATVSPANATNKAVTWSSSNSAMATVSTLGLVTGVAVGNATITATTVDGNRTATTSVRVISIPTGYKLISAGTFTMGSPSSELGRSTNETQHQVTLTRSFLMKTTEVTQGEWKSRMGNTNPSYFPSCGDNCPVEQVSWYSALAYANAVSAAEGLSACYTLSGCTGSANAGTSTGCTVTVTGTGGNPYNCTGYRLPTEAEWEYAARAGTDTAFYTGALTYTDCTLDAALNSAGWYCGNAQNTTHAVGGKVANVWGLYDMHGNVWEWNWDWYTSDITAFTTDPTGAGTGSGRVKRGGSWVNYAGYCRAAYRSSYYPGYRINSIGLRLARSM